MQLLVTVAGRTERITTAPCIEYRERVVGLHAAEPSHAGRSGAGVARADHFACADFFRDSTWPTEQVQRMLVRFLLQSVAQLQRVTGWRLLFLRIDDALTPKDAATTALEAVTFYHDHVEQRRQQKQYTNASRYVTLHLQLGSVQFTLAWRLNLSRKQVQRLNRARRETGQPRLTYHSLVELAEELLGELAPICRRPVGSTSCSTVGTTVAISNASFRYTAGTGFVRPNPTELSTTIR